VLTGIAAPMSQLCIFAGGLATFAIRFDVVHSAVFKRMNLILAELTLRVRLKEAPSEFIGEESSFSHRVV